MRRFMLAIALAAGFSATAGAQTVVGAMNSTLPPWRCGVDGTFAPHAFPTMDGKTQGFQVDLFDEIGKRMGRRIEITSASFSGLIPAMNAGRYDFLCAPTTVTSSPPSRSSSPPDHARWCPTPLPAAGSNSTPVTRSCGLQSYRSTW